jgi:hypothetical protein
VAHATVSALSSPKTMRVGWMSPMGVCSAKSSRDGSAARTNALYYMA